LMKGLAQAVQEQGAIGQSGERIVIGQVIQLRLLFHVIERERQVRHQVVEQPDFFGVEKVGFSGEKYQHRNELTACRQRERGGTAEAKFQGVLPPKTGKAVALDVVDDDALAASECDHPDTVGFLFLPASAEIDPPQRVGAIAVHGDRQDGASPRLHYARPRQFQLALFDQNPAGLRKQIFAVVYPDRGCVYGAEHRVHSRQAPNFFFLQHALGHVTICATESEQGAIGGQEWLAVALQPTETSVLMTPAQQHAVPTGLQPGRLLDQFFQLRVITFVYQEAHGAPGQLLGRVAEDSFRGGIVVGHPAPGIDLPDPFLGGFDDAAKAGFAPFKRFFHLETIGDVERDTAQHLYFAPVVGDRESGDKEGAFSGTQLDLLDGAQWLSRLERQAVVGNYIFRIFRRVQIAGRHGQYLRLGTADKQFESRVDE